MPLAFLTFFTGLAISAVAIYYSVIGLAAIFAAAVIPIMVMGAILEVSKLVAAWWLKANWHRAPFLLKSYMLVAVVVLMMITSMGIFGFLSKAHTDQAIPLGDTASQVAFIDEKINNERETIVNARSLIKQLDDAVAGIQSGEGREIRLRDGTTRIQNPAERALQVRRAQASDRAALTKTIEEAQARIVALQEEKAPIASKLRAVEAEVGPIKYIAKLIYGDNPDQNLLEKAVVWVIVIIVLVFDPLAVLLLLASQMSFRWAQEEREKNRELVKENTQIQESSSEPGPQSEQSEEQAVVTENKITTADSDIVEPKEETSVEEIPTIVESLNVEPKTESIVNELAENTNVLNSALDTVDDINDVEEEKILETVDASEKAAMKRWKAEDPKNSVKRQRHLFEIGLIKKLPWTDYLEEITEEQSAAIEAARWAEEQLDQSKKKDSDLDGKNQGTASQEISRRIDGYIQNAEQSDSTLWKRVQAAKGVKDE